MMTRPAQALALAALLVLGGCGGCDDALPDGPRDAGDAAVTFDAGDARPTDAQADTAPDVSTPSDASDASVLPDTSDTSHEDDAAACEADCDFDGLSDCEERELGTDPCVMDTDGDGLSDRREVMEGTDPLLADTDGDGASDAAELDLGLDPTRADTLADGTPDGRRWIVGACEAPETEPVVEHASASGRFRVALAPSVSEFVDLQVGAPGAAAVFADPVHEIAGFFLSREASASTDGPEAFNQRLVAGLGRVASIEQDFQSTAFETHHFVPAARAEFLLRPDAAMTPAEFRDALLFELAPFGRADVANLPAPAGRAHQAFRVAFSTIWQPVRGDASRVRAITSLAIAPAEVFDARQSVRFRLHDATNTTHISAPNDTIDARCATFAASDRPRVDFYWVINYGSSMQAAMERVHSVARRVVPRLASTALDYRLGVTSMGRDMEGRLSVPPGWHTDAASFEAETFYERYTPPSPPGQAWGFEVAYKGLRHMLGLGPETPSAAERIRPDAEVVTIFFTDSTPFTKTAPALRLHPVPYYLSFLEQHTTAFSILPELTPTCDGREDQDFTDYIEIARRTGGGVASRCADPSETIDQIIDQVQGQAGSYALPETPISSTIRVYIDGEWVPRSREHGFDYFPASNAIAFYGIHRPSLQTDNRTSHTIAVYYDTWVHQTKWD